MNLIELTSQQIQAFLLIFVRVTAIITLMPVFGSNNVQAKVKVAFSFVLAILIFPYIKISPLINPDFQIAQFIFLVTKEVFVGLALGYVSLFLLASAQFAGRLIDVQMGFALVQVIDPFNNARTTVVGQFQILLYSIIFLLINGHYFFILTLIKSFELIPLLTVEMNTGELAPFFISISGRMFVLAIRLAAPVFAVLLLGTIALGIVARTVPQINIFFVGIPMKIIMGILILAFALPSMVLLFRDMVSMLIADMHQVLLIL